MSNFPKSLEGKINDPQVTHLYLSNLGLNDNDIIELQERLQNNQRITSLNLSNNNITHEGCGILALMTNIKKIDLSHCDIGDKGVAVLVKTHINNLDVSDCGITEVGAKELQKNLKQYEALSIINNPNIPNELLQAIRSKFVESTEVFSSPLGIDLGLNIHNSYEDLLARRLVERGVRFIQLYSGSGSKWDAHDKIEENHTKYCGETDKPVAGLLMDLIARGLLYETLVIWGGEFGRTPISEKGDGRDHNPTGFTMWMAGGGVKGGQVIGATDEY